ncbi:MAG: alanine racemase [Acidobacteria bacterium]|nr:alanine racemase [Acidobacteriota bacterium]
MRIGDLPTPAFLVDRERVANNCERMRKRATEWGVTLRPHVKTHKTIEGARMQLGAPSGPITVSTLAEAEFFASEGFTDITWAVPVVPAKIGRAIRIGKGIERLSLVIDHADMVRELEAAGRREAYTIPVFIEIDCGDHRTGIEPGEEAVALARRVADASNLEFRGLLTHAGHSYQAKGGGEIHSITEQEHRSVRAMADELIAEGIDVPVVSAGSTPTTTVGLHNGGVTEIRPGNYVFFDAFQAALGSCTLDHCAVSVLATVIGCYPGRSSIVIDAGAIALSKDRGAVHLGGDPGYGIVCDEEGRVLEELHLHTLSQEHGEIATESAGSFAIGTKVRIIPNHSCLTAAQFEIYEIVEGAEVVDRWKPVNRW